MKSDESRFKNRWLSDKKLSKGTIIGGKECGPAQQDLVHAFDDDAAAGHVQRHPIQ